MAASSDIELERDISRRRKTLSFPKLCLLLLGKQYRPVNGVVIGKADETIGYVRQSYQTNSFETNRSRTLSKGKNNFQIRVSQTMVIIGLLANKRFYTNLCI